MDEENQHEVYIECLSIGYMSDVSTRSSGDRGQKHRIVGSDNRPRRTSLCTSLVRGTIRLPYQARQKLHQEFCCQLQGLLFSRPRGD